LAARRARAGILRALSPLLFEAGLAKVVEEMVDVEFE
jgi:hypothetical protein